MTGKTAGCKDQKKRAALALKDLKTIIRVQEKIIKARDHTFKIYERVLKQISSKSLIKLEAMEQQLELAYKDRNTAIRRYNALHQLGEMAEGMGVDLTAKLPENEKAKWDLDFGGVEAKVLESGRTAYSAISRKKTKSSISQDCPKKNGKGKKKE